MSDLDNGAIEVHLDGSPSVQAVADSAGALVDLINALAGKPLGWTVEARIRCDTCDTRSEPVPLDDPDATEAAIVAAGWVRDKAAKTDTCPTCARADR